MSEDPPVSKTKRRRNRNPKWDGAKKLIPGTNSAIMKELTA
jgi:hypothetical protein